MAKGETRRATNGLIPVMAYIVLKDGKLVVRKKRGILQPSMDVGEQELRFRRVELRERLWN